MSLLGIGLQSLRASQGALSVVGQNIANVNTEGYSRQIANLTTHAEQKGVQVSHVQRVTDDFLTRQQWADTANYNRTDIYATMASQLDNLLGDASTSISTGVDNFFNAMQNAVDDPTSIPNRELLVAEADALAKRFNSLDDYLARQNSEVNNRLESMTEQVNSLSSNIAEVNDKIRIAVVAGRPASELQDQRDELVKELSELVDVTVVDQNTGEQTVFIGNGQPLVVGQSANTLQAALGDPDESQFGVSIMQAGREIDITNELSSGQIGGMLSYRDEVLNPARDELGRIAMAISESMNELHQTGIDLNGEFGSLMFTDINSGQLMADRISAKEQNLSNLDTARVEITDLSKLQATEYELIFNTRTSLTLERASDGKTYTLDSLTQVTNKDDVTDGTYFADFTTGELVLEVDGMKMTLDAQGTFVEGDRFLIQPVRNGAAEIENQIKDGKLLALGSPIRVSSGEDNAGTGEASVSITDIHAPGFSTQGELKPPVEIVFNNSTPLTYTIMDMTDPAAPVPLDQGFGPRENIAFTAGEAIEIDGYEISIVNKPQAGDRFAFEYNTDGISDNRIALALSNLQQADVLAGGSYQEIYGAMVEKVGSTTAVAKINTEAQKAVLDSTNNTKASIVGVNMDEEAAKLVQFQQAYQASAQIIRASQTLFDSLLSSI
ncbi:flagellar hook-associated protein FlgK [Marinobacterium jannaschii]|uniref:flagellar hook-associated protein FlgK n=1 Tax=Marinobacterium jannaschii TaxID=64970 RepID=UPI00048414B0|nr:flagellar hook-associated protein FlgK [Marinobacterium jannaschii]